MIDLTEINNLPDEEKWKIIDEIEESMKGEEEWNEIDSEVLKEMERRIEDMRSGKDKGYTWEDAKAILLKEKEDRKIINAGLHT